MFKDEFRIRSKGMLAYTWLRKVIISSSCIGLPIGVVLAEEPMQKPQPETWAQPVSVSTDRFTFPGSLPGSVRPVDESQQQSGAGRSDGSAGAGIQRSGPLVIQDLRVPNTAFQDSQNKNFPEDMTKGRLPGMEPLPTGTSRSAPAVPIVKFWAPSAICHKPLYFQDTMLERHGHERFPCVQPLASGVRFFGTLPMLPYLWTLHPPCEDVYNLGHYRPGTAAPCLFERPPYDQRALRNEVLAVGAAAVAIP